MLECMIIGDSIAVGIESIDRKCELHAKVGANSNFIVRNYTRYAGRDVDYVVISMGSNWPDNPRNYENAMRIRQAVKEGTVVVWVLPYNRQSAATIRRVANRFNDRYVDLVSYRTRDRLHPRSYPAVNNGVQSIVKSYYEGR